MIDGDVALPGDVGIPGIMDGAGTPLWVISKTLSVLLSLEDEDGDKSSVVFVGLAALLLVARGMFWRALGVSMTC